MRQEGTEVNEQKGWMGRAASFKVHFFLHWLSSNRLCLFPGGQSPKLLQMWAYSSSFVHLQSGGQKPQESAGLCSL